MAEVVVPISGWERALMAAEKVKERLRRATRALDAAGVPYAVAGGNAVAEWVGRVDEDAVRNTRDVDLLIRRGDLPAVRAALEAVGFIYSHLLDIDVFTDGPRARQAAAFICSMRVKDCGRTTPTTCLNSWSRKGRPSFRCRAWKHLSA